MGHLEKVFLVSGTGSDHTGPNNSVIQTLLIKYCLT